MLIPDPVGTERGRLGFFLFLIWGRVTSMVLQFHICKMGIMVPVTRSCCRLTVIHAERQDRAQAQSTT